MLQAVGVVVAILFVLLLLRLLAPDLLITLVSPLSRAGSAVSASVAGTGAFFENKDKLVLSIAELERERVALNAENAVLAARVSDLTNLLGTRTERTPGILAGVVARPPVSPYDVLVIDAGAQEGVVPGALVHGAGGTPVGTVASRSAENARVLLFSSPGRETSVWAGEARIAMQMIGRGSGALEAIIPRDAVIAVGDLVYVAGPGSLPIGSVHSIHADPASPKAKVLIRPLTNPFQITWVTVGDGAAL